MLIRCVPKMTRYETQANIRTPPNELHPTADLLRATYKEKSVKMKSTDTRRGRIMGCTAELHSEAALKRCMMAKSIRHVI